MSFTKEQEIRPRDIFLKLLECCREDAKNLLLNGEFEDIGCPACLSMGQGAFFMKDGFRIVTCPGCGSLYVSPRPTKECINKFYPQSQSSRYFVEEFYPRVELARKEKLLPERAERLAGLLDHANKKSGVVIDIGAGQGFFLEVLRDRLPDFEYRAVEPNPAFVKICRDKGFLTSANFVENMDEWQGEADLVTCFEVFEHVQDPKQFVEKLKKLLKPGGSLLITSLTGDGFDIQVLREHADIVAPPQHLNYLSVAGYEKLFSDCGFSDVQISTPGRLDVNIVENKEKENPGIIKDRFVKNILKQSESVRLAFQKFLADNLLSSHLWVFATSSK